MSNVPQRDTESPKDDGDRIAILYNQSYTHANLYSQNHSTETRGLWTRRTGGMTRTLLSCSPHFTNAALNEIRRTHPQPDLTAEHIAPGFIEIQANCSFSRLTFPWNQKLPIYLHHAFPIRAVIALDRADDSLRPLVEAVRHIAPHRATLQVRSLSEWESPYSLPAIRRALGDCAPVTAAAPTGTIVSILVVPNETGARAYLGLSTARQNLSPWPGGVMPAAECVPNRAGYKLLEALASFSIRLKGSGRALDLGAAPGAWTTVLRRRGMHVTAVAPAPMYAWLAMDAGVDHQPMRAEEYLGRCETTFDLIVNDMKLDGQDSARVMAEYARHLRPDGIGIMTLKMRRENRLRVMDHSLRILRKAYRVEQVRQLVSNGHEVTVLLRRT